MQAEAFNFISRRKNPLSLTKNRIEAIIWYACECYKLLEKDNLKISKSVVKSEEVTHFEDHLKMHFVDEYMIKYKGLLKSRLSVLEDVVFLYENIKQYIGEDGKKRSDKIDIFINKLGLHDLWQTHDEHVYFVFECKIINVLSDTDNYINDIKKFCDRNYTQLRLPFEGMIGFMVSTKNTDTLIVNEINRRLSENVAIKTDKPLSILLVNNEFSASYHSMHKKNFGTFTPFEIFHLLFDYSNIIEN